MLRLTGAITGLSRSSVRAQSRQQRPAPRSAIAQRAAKMADPRLEVIKKSIREIPDFPKKGIAFKDITTLMLDPVAFKHTIDLFVERIKDKRIDAVVGFESRGFFFGPTVAMALGCAFVPLRKPKKLPGETIGVHYALEYGTDRIEMHLGAVTAGQRVVLIDDLLATGGTMAAGKALMDQVGAEVVEALCVIELPALKGRERLQGVPMYVLVEMEGD